jgi:hypothetical protein
MDTAHTILLFTEAPVHMSDTEEPVYMDQINSHKIGSDNSLWGRSELGKNDPCNRFQKVTEEHSSAQAQLDRTQGHLFPSNSYACASHGLQC